MEYQTSFHFSSGKTDLLAVAQSVQDHLKTVYPPNYIEREYAERVYWNYVHDSMRVALRSGEFYECEYDAIISHIPIFDRQSLTAGAFCQSDFTAPCWARGERRHEKITEKKV